MRAILQRVKKASVVVDEEVVGAIGQGILALVAAEHSDTLRDVQVVADKMAGLRMFSDPEGKMNLNVSQVGGAFLVVSQFTLAGSLRKGRRPSFDGSAPPAKAEPLIEELMGDLEGRGFVVAGGRFGADMQVSLINDGPVTFVLDVREGKVQR